MAVIEIEIEDDVLQELQQVLAAQAAQVAGQFRGEVPAGIPLTPEEWVQNVMEQNIAQIVAGVSRRKAAEDARKALQDAQNALVRAVAGVRSVVLQK